MGVDRRQDAPDRPDILPVDVDGGEGAVVSKGRAFLGRFLRAERRIFAYILTLLPHRADAEDVLQEVSAIMWEKFDERDPPRDFVAWGCRIAYFRIQDHRKEQRRRRVLYSEEMLEQVSATLLEEARALQLDARREALAHCLGKLGRRDRELLAERFKDGSTALSTAASVGRSVDAVYKALARIRKALHDCIARTIAAEGRA
jgi:RNA polymerase sigma-70 factor (ECF subfamily)